MRILLALLLLLLALAARADSATYYVDPVAGACSGNYSIANRTCTGTDGISYATPNISTSAAVAGDTVYIRAGTYTVPITMGTKSGTASARLVVSGFPGELPIIMPTGANDHVAWSTGMSYVTFQHMIWDGTNNADGRGGFVATASRRAHHIILQHLEIRNNSRSAIALNGDGNIVRMNKLHDVISRTGSAGTHGYGVYNNTGIGNIIEYNNIYNCVGGGIQSYPNVQNTVIWFNWIHDNNTWSGGNIGGIVVGGGATTGIIIYRNLITNNGSHPNAGSAPGISSQSGPDNVLVLNNTIYGNKGEGIWIKDSGSIGWVLQNNLIVGNTGAAISNSGTGTIQTTNRTTGPITDCTISTSDFRLKAGAPCNNAGTARAGFPHNGSAPDIGAFQTFAPVAAVANGTFIDITMQGANAPLQILTAAGFSIGCNDCGTLTVANMSMLAPAVLRLNVTGWTGGQCAEGKTVTVSFNSATGLVTDSAKIGNVLNQNLLSFSNFSVMNQCESGGPPPELDPELIIYEFDVDDGANVPDSSGGGHHGALENGIYVAGKYGQALHREIGTSFRVIVPYGEDLNPTAQDLTVCVGYLVPIGAEQNSSIIMGASVTAGRLFYVEARGGTWRVAVQASGAAAAPSNLAVQSGWNRVCLQVDSTAQTAQVSLNGVSGTGGALKSFTSYTLASNLSFGLPIGLDSAPTGGGGTWDRAIIWTSLQSIEDDWLAWEPPPPSEGSYAHVGHRFNKIRGNAEQYGAVGGSVEVIQGGAVAITTQTVCEGENPCSAIGERLWYSRNGGQPQPVPDEMTADQVAFYGQASGLYTGPTTGCFVGEPAECYDGTTQITSIALPEINLAAGEAITRRSVLRFGAEASGQYCFTERDQNGNELPGGAVPACVRIVPPMMSAGF